MEVGNLDISAIVSTLGVAGALVWYLYYTTSVTMPKRDEHYSRVLTEISKGFTDALKDEREFRKAELTEIKNSLDRSRCLLTLSDSEKLRRADLK